MILASYPIGRPGEMLGDGFFIRHGAETENTWYNPGYWHTGEDWYAIEEDTAGAGVYAIEDGEVVYIGGNYPGRVVIIRHIADFFSMYGHLDPAVTVQEGQQVARGALLGTVLRRNDQTPNHLHFEVRTFLIKPEVNGDTPRYGFRCGVNCPPGPGYWPISAPDLPDQVGWLNPIHLIARRMLAPGSQGEVVAATQPISPEITLWTALPGELGSAQNGTLTLRPGEKFQLLDMVFGPSAPGATSALAYLLWYKIQLPNGRSGWVQAAVPSPFETGSDGRPSSVRFNFVPAIAAEGG
jgi:murein DD-endopeptidase MepM/ murein hydrolase activator NlpD